jgi:hypothetical protein
MPDFLCAAADIALLTAPDRAKSMRPLSTIINKSEWCAAAGLLFSLTQTHKFRNGKIFSEMLQGMLVGATQRSIDVKIDFGTNSKKIKISISYQNTKHPSTDS